MTMQSSMLHGTARPKQTPGHVKHVHVSGLVACSRRMKDNLTRVVGCAHCRDDPKDAGHVGSK